MQSMSFKAIKYYFAFLLWLPYDYIFGWQEIVIIIMMASISWLKSELWFGFELNWLWGLQFYHPENVFKLLTARQSIDSKTNDWKICDRKTYDRQSHDDINLMSISLSIGNHKLREQIYNLRLSCEWDDVIEILGSRFINSRNNNNGFSVCVITVWTTEWQQVNNSNIDLSDICFGDEMWGTRTARLLIDWQTHWSHDFVRVNDTELTWSS